MAVMCMESVSRIMLMTGYGEFEHIIGAHSTEKMLEVVQTTALEINRPIKGETCDLAVAKGLREMKSAVHALEQFCGGERHNMLLLCEVCNRLTDGRFERAIIESTPAQLEIAIKKAMSEHGCQFAPGTLIRIMDLVPQMKEELPPLEFVVVLGVMLERGEVYCPHGEPDGSARDRRQAVADLEARIAQEALLAA
jgi:hypothetical protein